MFMARLPARKFRKYECTGAAALESKARNASVASDENKGDKKEVVGDVQTIEKVFGGDNKKPVGAVDAVETAINTR